MTTGSPSSGQLGSSRQAKSPIKRRRKVDIGVATIVAAVILACGGVAGVFIGRATTSGTSSTSTTSRASNAPTSVTITPPTTGTIPWINTLSGHVVNLQRGELLWTFFQTVNGNGSIASQTYPTSGPCTINSRSKTWTCRKAYIGKPVDHGTYRICVAVLNFSEAYSVVKLIENTYAKNLNDWFASPPSYIHDHSPACVSVPRKN